VVALAIQAADASFLGPGALAAPERDALLLLGALGGLMALAAEHLLTLWAGLALYVATRAASQRPADADNPEALWALGGLALLLLGSALIYASAATARLGDLSAALWLRAGPQPMLFYLGGVLCLVGCAWATQLVPPYPPAAAHELATPLIGVLAPARLYLRGSGALAWEWALALGGLGVVAVVGAMGASLLAQGRVVRIERWLMAQRGFLLFGLAAAFATAGLSAWLAGLVALLLAQAVTRAVLPQTPDAASTNILSPFVGLVRHSPWAGAPLLVALASLAAAPPTLGYAARAALLAVARTHLAAWVEPVATAMSVLYGLACVPWVLTLVRRGSRHAQIELAWPRALGLALATVGLVGLGLFPAPFQWLSQWLVGG
ncbi:MAG: hypothetical protein V1772_05850, partial [Chloroflexota bacterium]